MWQGDIEDLIKYGVDKSPNSWCIKFNGVRIKITRKELYHSYGIAKSHLRTHLFNNFCQGDYWHKDTNNTFKKEGGHNIPREELKKLAIVLLEDLLEQKIFTIEQI